MNDRTTNSTAEAEIRALMESWLSAVRAQNIKGIVPHYDR
jgi:ketosteroid isomerase-like protein